jgi:hypothetical protein
MIDKTFLPDMLMEKCVNLSKRLFVSVRIMESLNLEERRSQRIPLFLLIQELKNNLSWYDIRQFILDKDTR